MISNQQIALGRFRPHPDNYKRHPDAQIERLRSSIRKFGQVRSIVAQAPIDEAGDFLIVAGHGLKLAAEAEGVTELRADVIPADWTPEQIKAYLIADNRLAELSESDDQQLADLLGEIRQFDADLLPAIGYDAGETERLIQAVLAAQQPPPDPGPQDNAAEELRQKWGVEAGQLWALGDHRVLCGDCTDAAAVARLMGADLADLCVTSPPYAVGKEYEAGVSFAAHLDLLRGFADRAIEAIRPGGFIFVNFDEIAPMTAAGPLTGSSRQCIYLISKDYYRIFHEERRCDLYAQRIWFKPFNRLQQPFWTYNTSIPHHQEWEWLHTWRTPGGDTDPPLVFYAGTPDQQEWTHAWTWRTPGGDGDEVYDWDTSSRAVWSTKDDAHDAPLTRHVAAFHLGLPTRAIKAHSWPRAIVYEPFLGSGTTLIAAEQLNRQCRGLELSPVYLAVALERWATMTGRQPEIQP